MVDFNFKHRDFISEGGYHCSIKTVEEYKKEGFEDFEIWLIHKHDAWMCAWNTITEKQKRRYFIIQKFLGL